MIETKVICDDCGKSESFIPVDYQVDLVEHIESLGFHVFTKNSTGFLQTENEYCDDCAKKRKP